MRPLAIRPSGGTLWLVKGLRRALKPAIDYQRDCDAHICIGEVSVIRWALVISAHDYLRDVIDMRLGLAYRAFREWHRWSVEH